MAKTESGRRPARVMKTTYEKWQEGEKIPVLKAFFVDDVMKVGLEPWERMGCKGAFIDLAGSENTNGVYLCEVPPGKALKPQRHLYEEMIYVLSGRGGASVWYEEGRKQTFEWQAGSLFSPPLNAWVQLFNGSGSEPARFLAVTTAPLVINLFHNLDFLFNLDYRFTDRFNGEEGYFTQTKEASPEGWWRTNFVSNLGTFQPSEVEGQDAGMNRGVGVQTVVFSLAESTLGAHISQWPIGIYKKAHRHGPGANIIILRGRGYSLLWPEGKARQRIDWHPGSLFVPPPQWFHQHFNAGSDPVRFVALRWGDKFYMGGVFGHEGVGTDVKEGGNQIEYEDQDPEIHKLFVRECAKSGIHVAEEEFWRRRDP